MGLCVIVLSHLDSATVGKVYGVASQAMRIDLQAYKIDTVQISDTGHMVAGFVLCGLGQLIIRRWWVLPLMLVFFVALEVGQHFSPDRQADILDVMRGGVGALLGFVSKTVFTQNGLHTGFRVKGFSLAEMQR